MRPPLNAGEDAPISVRPASLTRASMRPPLNAGEDQGFRKKLGDSYALQ